MIDVLVTAWPNHPRRIYYAIGCLRKLRTHLTAGTEEIRWICSSETERDPKFEWYGDDLAVLCHNHGFELHWRDDKADLGGAMNAGFRLCESDCIFYVQDDYELTRPLDLSPGVQFLREHPDFCMARYHIAHTRCVGQIDGFHEARRAGPWFYGDNPGLWHKRFFEQYGWYVEGGDFGHSEVMRWHQLRDRGAKIAVEPKCVEERPGFWFDDVGRVSAVVRDHRDHEVPR